MQFLALLWLEKILQVMELMGLGGRKVQMGQGRAEGEQGAAGRPPSVRFCLLPAGIPSLITADMIKEGAAVIDVGITRVQDPVTAKPRLVGDVDFEGRGWLCSRFLEHRPPLGG